MWPVRLEALAIGIGIGLAFLFIVGQDYLKTQYDGSQIQGLIDDLDDIENWNQKDYKPPGVIGKKAETVIQNNPQDSSEEPPEEFQTRGGAERVAASRSASTEPESPEKESALDEKSRKEKLKLLRDERDAKEMLQKIRSQMDENGRIF